MRTRTNTIYPQLLNTNVANSVDIIKNDTTFYQVIGGTTSAQPIRSSTSLSGGSKVDPNSLNTYLVQQIANSRLNGYVPRDGAKYGIDGTPESWANFLTNLAGKESSFNNYDTGDIGRFNGGSNGLFQLSPDDALNYKLQDSPFTIQQLQDPYINANAAVKIAESLVTRDGVISGYSNGKYAGMSAYWGPLRTDWLPSETYQFEGELPTALAASTPLNGGNLDKQLDLSTQYWDAKKSGDPINSLTDFFNNLAPLLNDFNNDFAFYWYKKLQAQPDDIKNNVKIDDKSLLSEPSDSVGYMTNTLAGFSEYVSPVFDVPLDYGPPATIPASVQNKISPGTLEINYDLAYATTELQKTNQVALQKVNDTYNIATDSTQPHGLNLVTDIPSYQANYAAKGPALQCLNNNLGDNLFEYLNNFSNMNDQTGYNPRDYSKNLQSMPDFSYKMRVEDTVQSVDILKKKVKPSINYRTIKKALACRTRSSNRGVTTSEINASLLYQNRTVGLKTPISFSSKASSQLASALQQIKIPNTIITGLNEKIAQTGIAQLPFSNQLLAPLNNLTGAVNSINGSIGSLAGILQPSSLNMPNVLPSLDPGSFPQIYSLITNTSFNNLNAGTIFDTAQQVKGIICDFKLPIIGKVNWDNIANTDITKNFDDLFKSIEAKLPKFDDFKKILKGLLPDFKGIWDSFYKSFFDCENKNDYK